MIVGRDRGHPLGGRRGRRGADRGNAARRRGAGAARPPSAGGDGAVGGRQGVGEAAEIEQDASERQARAWPSSGAVASTRSISCRAASHRCAAIRALIRRWSSVSPPPVEVGDELVVGAVLVGEVGGVAGQVEPPAVDADVCLRGRPQVGVGDRERRDRRRRWPRGPARQRSRTAAAGRRRCNPSVDAAMPRRRRGARSARRAGCVRRSPGGPHGRVAGRAACDRIVRDGAAPDRRPTAGSWHRERTRRR